MLLELLVVVAIVVALVLVVVAIVIVVVTIVAMVVVVVAVIVPVMLIMERFFGLDVLEIHREAGLGLHDVSWRVRVHSRSSMSPEHGDRGQSCSPWAESSARLARQASIHKSKDMLHRLVGARREQLECRKALDRHTVDLVGRRVDLP